MWGGGVGGGISPCKQNLLHIRFSSDRSSLRYNSFYSLYGRGGAGHSFMKLQQTQQSNKFEILRNGDKIDTGKEESKSPLQMYSGLQAGTKLHMRLRMASFTVLHCIISVHRMQ